MSHTPTSWVNLTRDEYNDFTTEDGTRFEMGEDGQWHVYLSPLFQAAPELLAACKAALAVEDQIGERDTTKGRHDKLIAQLQAAIAKAEAEKGGAQ